MRGYAIPPPPAPARTHAHVAVHRCRGGEVFPRFLALARALVELTEAEMTVRDDGPPSLHLGGGHGLAIARLGALGIEAVSMACDVRE